LTEYVGVAVLACEVEDIDGETNVLEKLVMLDHLSK
jgi:hypothetical protein